MALVLTVVIGVIILVALYRLTVTVFAGLLVGALDPLDHRVFQAVFGEIMTLLIALEIAVSYWLLRERDDRLPPA